MGTSVPQWALAAIATCAAGVAVWCSVRAALGKGTLAGRKRRVGSLSDGEKEYVPPLPESVCNLLQQTTLCYLATSEVSLRTACAAPSPPPTKEVQPLMDHRCGPGALQHGMAWIRPLCRLSTYLMSCLLPGPVFSQSGVPHLSLMNFTFEKVARYAPFPLRSAHATQPNTRRVTAAAGAAALPSHNPSHVR